MTLPNSAITVHIIGVTDVGLVREHNEDNFLVVDLDSGETDFGESREVALGPRGALLVVCDGMGGAAAGEVASLMAVDVMLREMTANPPSLAKEPLAEEPPSETTAAAKSDEKAALGADPEPKAEVAPAPVDEVPAARLSPRAVDDLLAGLADNLPDSAPAPLPGVAPVSLPGVASLPGAGSSAGLADGAASSGANASVEAAPRLKVLSEAELHGLARKLRISTTKANQEIYEAACADIAKAGMGTTLTGLLLLSSHVIVAQVGDSRAYLWRRGKLTQITHDQSLVNQLLDSGQITPEQAKLFEHSNVILQALGVQEDIEVVLSTEVVRRDDRLLLCSDGLVGVVSDEEIQEVLSTSEKIEEAARRLIDLARAGGGPDNITVIVAQVAGELAPLPEPPPADEVLYRPLYMDGERPQERRVWAPEYGFIGQPLSGREMPMAGVQSTTGSSRTSVVAMSAVLMLLLAGIVVGILYYKSPPTAPQGNLPHAGPVVPADLSAPAGIHEDAGSGTDAAAVLPVGPPPDVAPDQPQPGVVPKVPGELSPAPAEDAGKIIRRHKLHRLRPDRPVGSESPAAPADGGTSAAPEKPTEKPIVVTPDKPAGTESPPPTEKPIVVTPEKPVGAEQQPAPTEKPIVVTPEPLAPAKPPAAEKGSEKPAAPDKAGPAAEKPAGSDKPAPAQNPSTEKPPTS